MANKVIKWKVFLSKRRNVLSHTAPSATGLQKMVELRLTYRHSVAHVLLNLLNKLGKRDKM